MNRLETHWLGQIQARRDGVQGCRVLVACSGGGDSMALLLFLWRLAPRLGLDLVVAHAHHGLRPEAVSEADLVRDTCRRLDVDLIEGWLDVRAHARQSRQGLETAARELRLAFLQAEAASCGASCIATGHTCEDHTETLLMRLVRGGGSGCLTPLAAREGLRWSPLVEAKREALRDYLRAAGLGWQEDASNAEDFTLRNRLRPLLAQLRAETPALDRHIWETHRQVADLEALRDAWLADAEGAAWEIDGAALLLAPDLPEAQVRWILAEALPRLGVPTAADHLRPLAAWLATRLASRNPAPRAWGHWTLEACAAPFGAKPRRRLLRRGCEGSGIQRTAPRVTLTPRDIS